MASAIHHSPPLSEIIDTTSILSLLGTVVILFAAYALSVATLPRDASRKTRFIFIWHLFDALIHFIFEGSFLYYSFFAWRDYPELKNSFSPHVLGGNLGRAYGADHSEAPLALMWQEYGKADRRWGVADVNVISLELLTVFIGGPLALWIVNMVRKGEERRWFWIVVLATGELYGGEYSGATRFMTFAPEWLTGSHNLNTSNFMYLWIYLFFFNTLWVWIPLWLLYEAYNTFLPALALQTMVSKVSNTASSLQNAGFESSEDEEESEGEGVSLTDVLEGKKVR
ncbi:hypothetical protein RUND412_002426 [Rhizina undulata]